MLEGKHCGRLDMVFSFVASIIDRTTAHVGQAYMSRFPTTYSVLDCSLSSYKTSEMVDELGM